MRRTALPAIFFATALVTAFQTRAPAETSEETQADWHVEETRTEHRYELRSGKNRLTIECVTPRFGGGAVLDIVVDGTDPEPRSTTEILVGDDRYLISHDIAGIGVTDCSACEENFLALWAALKRPEVKEVTIKRGQKREYLPARGGAEVLGACPPG